MPGSADPITVTGRALLPLVTDGTWLEHPVAGWICLDVRRGRRRVRLRVPAAGGHVLADVRGWPVIPAGVITRQAVAAGEGWSVTGAWVAERADELDAAKAAAIDQHPAVRKAVSAFAAAGPQAPEMSLAADPVTAGYIAAVLTAADGNQSEAARRMGVSRRTFVRRYAAVRDEVDGIFAAVELRRSWLRSSREAAELRNEVTAARRDARRELRAWLAEHSPGMPG